MVVSTLESPLASVTSHPVNLGKLLTHLPRVETCFLPCKMRHLNGNISWIPLSLRLYKCPPKTMSIPQNRAVLLVWVGITELKGLLAQL